MIILAGVAISMAMGDGGVITQGETANAKMEQKSVEEVLQTSYYYDKDNPGKLDYSKTKEAIENNLKAAGYAVSFESGTQFPIKVKATGKTGEYSYKVSEIGETIISNEENKNIDYAKRLEEIFNLAIELGYYDKDNTPPDELERVKEEMEKLEVEFIEIMGEKATYFNFHNENDEDKDYLYMYDEINNRFFRKISDYSGDEEVIEVTNVEKTDEANEVLETLLKFKEYLEEEFVGETYDEIKTMINNNQFESNIQEGYEASNEFENLRGIVPVAGDIVIGYEFESKVFSDGYYDIWLELITEPHRDRVTSITTSYE